jgi:hypothetical protein
MKEYAIITVGVIVFYTVVITLISLGMDFAFNRANRNAQITPIILHCPDNTKQIIIPDASKLNL